VNLTVKKILIIDDTPTSLKVVSECLKSLGCEILAAQDGTSGLLISREQQPDLILLDVMMPEMDGFETCRHLKAYEETKRIPVIFMTALSNTDNKVKGFEVGGVDYITKPIQLEELLVRVRTQIALHEMQQQLENQNKQLQLAHAEMERRVAQRTAELKEINLRLKSEIEERKLAEEKYILVMESSPVPIIVYDMQGQTIYINPVFTRVFGWTLEEMQGDPVSFVPESKQVATFAFMEKIKEGEAVGGFETQRLNKKGQPLDIIMSGDVWRDRSGAPAGSVIILLDVTEQKKIMAQYHQAQKMEAIGQLTGGVAHDFNNILTVILGVTDFINYEFSLEHRLKARLEQIQSAAERAADLVRQLLAFSRQQVLQPQVMNLNEVIVNFEKMLRRVISEDIVLETAFDKGLDPVKADPGQIEQVLMNLAVNARDAMPKGGRLTIETANVRLSKEYACQHVGVTPGNYVLLAVSDTGVGMDGETRNHIFEPFFTTKPKGEGTGLGLSTVYGIVNQSGGHIWVYSEPGQGASFKIYLPKVEFKDQLDQRPQSIEKARGGTETILVVEDESIVRDLVRDTLRLYGYQILEAENGHQAQEVCEGHPEQIDLLLTDVVIPGGLSGRQLAERLTSRHAKMKVIYMSGYTNSAIVNHGILEPGIVFIQKPFMSFDLAAKVRQVLDVPQSVPIQK
jgi:PAS domain S-box-containing protein